MQSDKYWALRALQREQEAYDSTTDIIHRLHAIYFDAAARLTKMAQYIFGNFAKSTGGMIETEKAEKLLSMAETAEVLEKLHQEYTDTGSLEALAKLNAPAYAYRISRVQAMRRAVDAEVQSLAEMETQIGAPHLAKTYDEAYYKTLYDRAKEPEGIPSPKQTAPNASASIKGPAFDRLSDRTIQQALENRWHGENYSERVWKNTHIVAKEAGRIIDEGVASGTSVANMSTEIKNLFGVAYYAAERLVRTETSRMHNDATLRGYKAMGVEQYTWLGTLDARTCELCGALDGKHFKLSEAVTGKTLPPRHPNCRCTTIAYYPGEASGSTRTARDPETGRNYKVPAGMTYEDWRKDVGSEALDSAQKRYANLKRDMAEQRSMQKILGKNVPSKIADYQDLKYNNPEEWRLTKYNYRLRSTVKANPDLVLPNAEKMQVDEKKYTGYLFNPDNKNGWPKGQAITSRLGYSIENYSDLDKLIKSQVLKYPATFKAKTQYGKKYEVKMVLKGLTGKQAKFKVGVIVDNSGIPKLTTAFIDKIKEAD